MVGIQNHLPNRGFGLGDPRDVATRHHETANCAVLTAPPGSRAMRQSLMASVFPASQGSRGQPPVPKSIDSAFGFEFESPTIA